MKFVLVVMLAISLSCGNRTPEHSLRDISDALNVFSTSLFKKLAAEERGNLVISPLSAHMLLSMAAYGADGKTADQMKKVLGLSKNDSIDAQGFQNLIQYLTKLENVTIEVANSLYVSDKLPLRPEYKNFSSSYFQSYTAELNFDKVKESVAEINSWVNEKTHSKIPKLVDEGFIEENTKMLLLNAVYFKSSWEDNFAENLTTDRYFHSNGMTIVPTMYVLKEFSYGEMPKNGANFIEIPYKNKNIKMVIIVPSNVVGLKDVIEHIEDFDEEKIAPIRSKALIDLYLPKFKIESSIPLRKPLEDLGMTTVFTSDANFSKMSKKSLSIAKVLQKAMIDVNESGTEAAVATGTEIINLLGPLIFSVDRPFYYRIVDSSNKLILFQGIVQNPTY